MLTLYVKTGCPFCAAVLRKVEELGLAIEEKNIADDTVATELIARGGKRQVPYLVDSERATEMYESGDIVDYLDTHYGNSFSRNSGEMEGEGKAQGAGSTAPGVCTLE